MSTSAQLMEQRRKLSAWVKYFKSNSQIVDLTDKSEESKLAQQAENEFVALRTKTFANLQLPEAHRNEPNRAQRYDYAIIARVTLLSMKNGFFGRTYQSSQTVLDSTTLKPVGDQMTEYVTFFSKVRDADLHAVIEFILIIKEKSAQAPAPAPAAGAGASAANQSQEEEKKGEEEKKTEESKASEPVQSQASAANKAAPAPKRATLPQKTLGIGFCVVPLYGQGNAALPDGVKTIDLLQGSPRILMSGKPITSMKKGSCSFSYEIFYGNQNEAVKNLQYVVPQEILIGPNDKIPGLKATTLPARFSSFDEQIFYNERKTLYAHKIRISSINEIESGFKQYLRKLCMQNGADQNRGITAEVIERKLSVVPHNTWRQIGNGAIISLNEDSRGNIESSGSLKILDYCMHELVALIIKLQYRVQLRDPMEGNRMQDFVIGQAIHLPHITKEGNLPMIETQLDIKMGPGVTLTGEMLWDYSQVRPANGPKLLVKMAALFSLEENLVVRGAEEMAKVEQEGDEQLEMLRNAVAEEHKDQMSEKDREIARIKAENEKLKNESDQIVDKIKKPDDQSIKSSAENQELERAKEYYLNKNVEIEQLIQQVMNGGPIEAPASAASDVANQSQKPNASAAAKSIMGQSPQQIESLLRFLIYLVLHKEQMSPEDYKKGQAAAASTTEQTKKSLLELLKNDDGLRQSLFGHLKAQETMSESSKAMDKVSDQDRANLNQMSAAAGAPAPFHRDLNAEQRLMKPNMNMEIEINDVLKANQFCVKFIGLNTASSLPPNTEALPKSLFFTFKFYTFQAVQTEQVSLMTTKSIEAGQFNAGEIELAKKYYLVQDDELRLFTTSKPAIEQILDRSLAVPFDVNPLVTGDAKEHEKFAKYLKDQVLSIDVWNGEDQTHYGSTRVPLYRLLRQGQPSNVQSFQLDLYEPNMNMWVGQLMLQITNQGKRVDLEDMVRSPKGAVSAKLAAESPLKQSKGVTLMGSAGGATLSDNRPTKKVKSRPLDQPASQKDRQTQMEDLLKTIGTTFDYKGEQQTVLAADSEQARKRLRIARMKKQAAASEVDAGVLNDPDAFDWQKEQTLRQIQEVREMKKRQLMMASRN